MINKARLIFVTISVMCLLPGLVFADGKLSLRLQGGWTYILGGDVNRGTQNWFYYNKGTWPAWNDGFHAVNNGYEFGGDIIFALTPRLGISIGAGYLRISRASSMGFLTIEPSLNMGGASANPKLSAVLIRVGIHLTMPLSGKVNFLAAGGLSYYFKTRYSAEWTAVTFFGEMLASYTQITTYAETKKSPLGLQGGIGLEYRLLPNLFLSLGALGRYARFRSWEGSSEFEIFESYEGTTTFSEQGILYYEFFPNLPYTPRLIMIQSSPSITSGPEPHRAVIDFSGISLQLGIRIRL